MSQEIFIACKKTACLFGEYDREKSIEGGKALKTIILFLYDGDYASFCSSAGINPNTFSTAMVHKGRDANRNPSIVIKVREWLKDELPRLLMRYNNEPLSKK